MLQALQGIQKLERKLLELTAENLIRDYRISLKTDMRVEIFVLVENENFSKNRIEDQLSAASYGFNQIELNTVTSREKDYDPLYKHIFSDQYPSPNSKVDLGLVWRFDTLLNEEQQKTVVENPCNVVTFYSYKGGMGRTTTLCSYAIHLANKGKKVVIIDCDFEAPGLTNFFNIDREQGKKSGLVEYLLDKEFVGEEKISSKLQDSYLIKVSDDYCGLNGSIHILPAGNLSYTDVNNEPENNANGNRTLRINLYHYIHGLARLNLSHSENMILQFRKLFQDLADQLHLTGKDYVLIDSRTGFNEIFGVTALNLSNMIIGFFGSSEQTRPGLYFLLDKYQEINHQPKLALVNSIVPGELQASELFENGFKNLLETYVDSQDGEWDPIASIPLFTFHENKVLKEIGVRYYNNDELNEEKERKLIELIKKGKTSDYADFEKAFEDLNKIFTQLDEFSSAEQESLLNFEKLSTKELRDVVLGHLAEILRQDEKGVVSLFAEDKSEIDVNTFFYRECMKELFKKDKFIIQGFKGSGKTYLYKSLKDKRVAKIILEKSGQNNLGTHEFIDIIEAKGAKNNYKQFPFLKEEVKTITNFQSLWKIYFWSSTMLEIEENESFKEFRVTNPNVVLQKDIEFLKEATDTERKKVFLKYINDDEMLILLEKDLKALNDFLANKNIKLFLLFDQLDRIANLEDWGRLITPLVEFWRDNFNKPSFANIFPKIFIRTDILPRVDTNNSLSLKTAKVEIEWQPDEIYAYFFKLVFSNKNSQSSFFKLMSEYKEIPEAIGNSIKNTVEEKQQLPLDQTLLRPLLNTFFGNDIKSPKGGSLGNPYEFFFRNFSNANETFNLRPFINLISGAVKNAISNKLPKYVNPRNPTQVVYLFPEFENNPPQKPILHYCYSTDSDVREAATQEHFDDLTNEAGNEPLKDTITFIKSTEVDKRLKKVVLTEVEMDSLLEGVLKSPNFRKKGECDKKGLINLITVNGLAIHDPKHRIYRFAQMYKYWLGLASRREDTVEVGQRIKNKISSLRKKQGFGFITTGYKSPELYFHATNVIGGNFDDLSEGDLVEFTVSSNKRGACAIDVKKVR